MTNFVVAFIYWALTAIVTVIVFPYVFVCAIISKAIEYFSRVRKMARKAYYKNILWEDYISIMDFFKAFCFFVSKWLAGDE